MIFWTLFTQSAFQPTFGPEFNVHKKYFWPLLNRIPENRFINGRSKRSEIIQKAADHLTDDILKNCDDCQILLRNNINLHGKYHYSNIELKDVQLQINLTEDNGVIEINMNGKTIEEIEKVEDRLQKVLFDSFKRNGLTPYIGAGQLHVGLDSTFKSDLLLFRNFIVDMISYSRVFYDLFEGTKINCPTLDMLESPKKDEKINFENEFTDLISKFDAETDWSQAQNIEYANMRIRDLAERINSEIYFRSNVPAKFQFLNLLHINSHEFDIVFKDKHSSWIDIHEILRMGAVPPENETVEIRGLPEVESARQYTILTRLIHQRLLYLKSLTRPILFQGIIKPKNKFHTITLFQHYSDTAEMPWKKSIQLLNRGWPSLVKKVFLTKQKNSNHWIHFSEKDSLLNFKSSMGGPELQEISTSHSPSTHQMHSLSCQSLF
jgi:hypothetical protein